MRKGCILLTCVVAACAGGQNPPEKAQPLPAVEVFFTPPPFPYRVGPEVTSSAEDTSRVRNELAAQGATLGCDAVVDVTISTNARNGKARSWGFCAYRVARR